MATLCKINASLKDGDVLNLVRQLAECVYDLILRQRHRHRGGRRTTSHARETAAVLGHSGGRLVIRRHIGAAHVVTRRKYARATDRVRSTRVDSGHRGGLCCFQDCAGK